MFMFEKICIKNIGVHHNLEKIKIGTTFFSFLTGCIVFNREKHHNDFHLQMMPENVKLVQPFFGWDG